MDDGDKWYASLLLDMAFAWKRGIPIVAGGYLDQPYQLMADMQTAVGMVKEREGLGTERDEIASTFDTKHPDVPLPPVPKELISKLGG